CLVREVFIEAPVLRRLADLPPFAGLASGVTILLQESGDGVFVLGFGARTALPPRLVQETAGAKGVTTRHEQAARRAAQRRCIAGFETQPCPGQCINVRRLRLIDVGAVTAD